MVKRRHTRREFLKGLPARDALADRMEQAAAAGREKTETSFLWVSRRAMAAEFEVVVRAGQYPQATEAALAALDEVERLEERLSVFRPTSEVSRINEFAASGPVEVAAELFELIELAVRLHRETGGALDVTAGPLSEVWGFARGQGAAPEPAQIAEALARTGSDKLELDAARRTVRFRVPGVWINLGAIGKGYAVDRAAAVLAAQGIEDFMVHGGQSSVVARGSSSAADGQAGWAVGVHDPLGGERRLGEVRLMDRALGTSGSQRQFFMHGGRRLGHVLDPRTGWPAEGLLAATVVAPTAAEADGLSTAMFVMGLAGGMAFCEAREGLAAVFVWAEGDQVRTRACGFAAGEWAMPG
jgi:FAD:protein FMN transferase